jgi:hypothetical protein
MKITDQRLKETGLIRGGDLIMFAGSGIDLLFMVLESNAGDGQLSLVDVRAGRFYIHPDPKEIGWFRHPAHLRNHLKKHYGEYQHIKNSQLEVIIHDATTEGF